MLIDRRFIVLAETKPSLHVPRGAVGGGRGAQQGLGNLLRMATGLLTTFDGLIATNSPR